MPNQQGSKKAEHPPYQDFAGCSYEQVQRILYQHTAPAVPVRSRGGAKVTFPMKLHSLLDSIVGKKSAISWQHHGRAFKIHDKERFTNEILPAFFSSGRQYPSFHRQLNIYIFLRISGGPDAGAYYHPLFLRSRPELCDLMQRKVAEKNNVRTAMDPATEPDLCILPPMQQSSPDSGGRGAFLLDEISFSGASNSSYSSVAGTASARRNPEQGGDTCSDNGDGIEEGASTSRRPQRPEVQMGVDEAHVSHFAAARSPKRRKKDSNADNECLVGDGDKTAGVVAGSLSEVNSKQTSQTEANLKDPDSSHESDDSTMEDHASVARLA